MKKQMVQRYTHTEAILLRNSKFSEFSRICKDFTLLFSQECLRITGGKKLFSDNVLESYKSLKKYKGLLFPSSS